MKPPNSAWVRMLGHLPKKGCQKGLGYGAGWKQGGPGTSDDVFEQS